MKTSFLIIPMLLLGAAAKRRSLDEVINKAKRVLIPAYSKSDAAGVPHSHADQAMALPPRKDNNAR